MSIRRAACAVMISTLVPSSLLAADSLSFDLAAQAPGTTETEALEPGSYRVRILNRMPNSIYEVSLDIETMDIDPLTLPSASRTTSRTGFCPDAETLLSQALDTARSEREVASEIAKFRKAAVDENCDESVVAALEVIITTSTTRIVPRARAMAVQKGERLVVVVTRRDDDGNDEAVWKRIYSTGSRGEWRITYGFNFIPNEDETFFTEQSDTDPAVFIVTEDRDRREWDFAPSFFFTWLPNSKRNRTWHWGPTAGLGFDLDDPIVFAGLGGTFNENVMLTGGVVFHKQSRLIGRYEPGQEIGTSLDPAQLAEETYDVNVYIGIGFRFGSSPYETTGGAAGSR